MNAEENKLIERNLECVKYLTVLTEDMISILNDYQDVVENMGLSLIVGIRQNWEHQGITLFHGPELSLASNIVDSMQELQTQLEKEQNNGNQEKPLP